MQMLKNKYIVSFTVGICCRNSSNINVLWVSFPVVFYQGDFASCCRVSTTIWLHHLDFNKRFGERTRRKLHKDAASCFENSWKQHPTKQQLHGHLVPISQTILERPEIHSRNCWWSKDELISEVLQWTPTDRYNCFGRPANTFISSLRILGAVKKTSHKWWLIRMDDVWEPKESVFITQLHHDDNESAYYKSSQSF